MRISCSRSSSSRRSAVGEHAAGPVRRVAAGRCARRGGRGGGCGRRSRCPTDRPPDGRRRWHDRDARGDERGRDGERRRTRRRVTRETIRRTRRAVEADGAGQAERRRWRRTRRRSRSVSPPQTPCFSRTASACSRHASRTGHCAQIALAGGRVLLLGGVEDLRVDAAARGLLAPATVSPEDPGVPSCRPLPPGQNSFNGACFGAYSARPEGQTRDRTIPATRRMRRDADPGARRPPAIRGASCSPSGWPSRLTAPGPRAAHFGHPPGELDRRRGLRAGGRRAPPSSWPGRAEVLQLDVSAGLALAVLALIAVLPEYAVDFVFTSKAGTEPGQVRPARPGQHDRREPAAHRHRLVDGRAARGVADEVDRPAPGLHRPDRQRGEARPRPQRRDRLPARRHRSTRSPSPSSAR